jgi:Rieske Fe-S protein
MSQFTDPPAHQRPLYRSNRMSDSSEMNRRTFLAATATAAAALALPVLPTAALADAPTSAPANSNQFDVGPLSNYNHDGVTSTWAAKPKAFFVIRNEGKLYASSSLCTHRRCVLTAKPDELYCKCHQSEFSFEGTVTDGPAKRSLERYAISTSGDNHVMVDKSSSFSEANWDDPASFIAVK